MRRARKAKVRAVTLPLLPSLQAVAPPLVQRESGKVVKTEWTDPDDLNPNRRAPRSITGWRRFCPLRKVLACHGTRAWCTIEMVVAADLLRHWHDVARIGLSAERDGLPVTAAVYGPRAGPSWREHKRVACWRSFARAWVIFDAQEKTLIQHVVLQNRSLESWEAEQGTSKSMAVRRIRPAMDKLVAHLKGEIDQTMNRGEIDLSWGA